MTLAEIISTARIRLDDTVQPYLWSDAELEAYAQEAEREAAERARLLPFDTVNDLVVDPVTVAADTVEVEYPELVFEVNRAVWVDGDGNRRVLGIESFESLDTQFPAKWEEYTGRPVAFIPDQTKLRIFRIPESDGTLHLKGYRLPLQAGDVALDIPERHHERLVDWVIYRAYEKNDADVFNPQGSAAAVAAFERSFGYRHDANAQRKRHDPRPKTIKYSGY